MDKEEKNQPEVVKPDSNQPDPPDSTSLEAKPIEVEKTSVKDKEESNNPDALQERPGKADDGEKQEHGPKLPLGERLVNRIKRVNPYLFLFVSVILIAVVVVAVAQFTEKQGDPGNVKFEGSQLDQETLDQLLSKESNVGTVDQTLTVAANAIFEGKVLVKSDLDVAGKITVGGPLSLPGITVSGSSSFDDVQIKTLSILGSATIQQSLNVQENANISGNVSVGGTVSAAKISADVIEFTQGLQLNGHIDTGGGIPSVGSGSAVGGGGTVSISGNDTAGTVVINTGGGPPAGILARITFTNSYNTTPQVQITPVNSSTGSLQYYVERSSSGFSIGTTNAPSSATTYVFDYFIVE